MTIQRSTAWLITSTQEVKEKVVFPFPMTMQEAEDAYLAGEFEDIIDSESLGVDEVIHLKAF